MQGKRKLSYLSMSSFFMPGVYLPGWGGEQLAASQFETSETSCGGEKCCFTGKCTGVKTRQGRRKGGRKKEKPDCHLPEAEP